MLESDESKRNLNKIIDRFLDSKEEDEKQDQLSKLVKVLQIPEYILLLQKDKELKAKIETVVRELWVNMHVWDSSVYRHFYMAIRESELIQNFYTKALANEKNTDLAREYLKSNVKLFNSQDIIDNITEIADLTDLWDYAALLLSANGIFDENLFRKYINTNSFVINKEIIKNYKSSNGKRELLKFLKLITIAEPSNSDYIIDYLETLDLNMETPSLVSLLKTVDIANFKDEGSLLRLSSLFIKVGDYQNAIDILQKILLISQNNQEAIELYIDALGKTNEWERIIAFLTKRKSIMGSSKQLEESFIEACVKMRNYREAIDYIESSGMGKNMSQKSILYVAQLYLFENNLKKAKDTLAKASRETLNSKNGLKLDAELSKLEGNNKEYMQKCIKYIKDSPEDISFTSQFLKDMETRKMWNKITEVQSISNLDLKNQELLPFFIIANLENGKVEEAIASVRNLDFQHIDDRIHIAFLRTMRNNENWANYAGSSGNLPIQLNAYLNLIKDYIYGNSLKENYLGTIEGLIEGNALSNLIKLNRLWKQIDSTSIEDAESEINGILKQHGTGPGQDLMFYNYPRINLFLKEGNYEEANKILSNLQEQDPYLTYFEIISENSVKISKSKAAKLESAYNLLSANPIRGLMLQVKIDELREEEIVKEVEQIVNSGGGLYVPWMLVYSKIQKMDEPSLLNFIDLLEFSGVENPESLRVLREVKKKEGNFIEVLNIGSKICGMRTKEESDIINYIMDLKEYGSKEKLDSVINEYASLKLPASINGILGDYYLVNKDPITAEHFFRKSLQEETKEETLGGLVETLIEQGRFKEAEKSIEQLKNKPAFTLKLYEVSGNVEKLNLTIKGINKVDSSMEPVLENIVDRYWENRIIRSQLISLLKRTANTSLGLDISSRMISEQKNSDSLEVLRMLFRNNPEDARIISILVEKLSDAGKFEEANTDCSQYLKLNIAKDKRADAFARMERINFNNGLYKEVLKLYEAFPTILNEDSTETVTLTLIKVGNFAMAEDILSKEHQKTLTQEKFTYLMGVLKKTANRTKVIALSEKLMKACIKHNKFLDKREAVVHTRIEVSKIDEIYDFLNTPTNFEGIDIDYLERESCRIMKNIYRKTGITTVEELNLPLFFLGNGSKDIELAKMLKDYVDDSYYHFKVKHIPKDPATVKLLHEAASMPFSNPFVYSVKFNLGIRGAIKLKVAVESLDGGFA